MLGETVVPGGVQLEWEGPIFTMYPNASVACRFWPINLPSLLRARRLICRVGN
jgi:hypothetical protein